MTTALIITTVVAILGGSAGIWRLVRTTHERAAHREQRLEEKEPAVAEIEKAVNTLDATVQRLQRDRRLDIERIRLERERVWRGR